MTEIQDYPQIFHLSNTLMYRTMYAELEPRLAEITKINLLLMALV